MVATPDEERVQVLVPRDSHEETTFTLVRCAKGERVSDAADLHRQVTAAVTRWVRQTESGREAFERSSEDYNVGDLAGDLGDPDLTRLLLTQGVRDLTIDVYSSGDAPSAWAYDTHLVDASELEAPEDDA